jgi:general secretion pathway protein L
MKALDAISNGFWQWLDHVAEAMIAVIARVVTPRSVGLVEQEHGQFAIVPSDERETAALRNVTLRVEGGAIAGRLPPELDTALRGSRVELTLRADRFVFKPLDLPSRAVEFLDGVVRSQIDRLTPWSADRAAFGFSAPVDAGAGRLVVTVAATAKAMLEPFVQAFAAKGANAVAIATRAPEATPEAPPITIMAENLAGILGMRMARRILVGGLAACGLLAATAVVAATIINGNLETRQDELARRIAQQRAAALTARSATDDPTTAAERALAKRKNETPSAVIAIEVLSRILPDHTYVTELRIDADKLRLSGITHDAPGLIRLMERTPQFAQATFFAPITRSSSDPGDRFNIEARIEPVFSPTP